MLEYFTLTEQKDSEMLRFLWLRHPTVSEMALCF